jgi:hypothetical protein
MSEIKETEEAADNTEFISTPRRSTNSLPRSLAVVCRETFSN